MSQHAKGPSFKVSSYFQELLCYGPRSRGECLTYILEKSRTAGIMAYLKDDFFMTVHAR